MTTLRDYQVEFVSAVCRDLMEFDRVLGVAATGCHAAGTRILMHDGTTKAVEDIVEGDALMGPDSKPRKVLRLIRGHGQMYRITPTKGDPFVINEDHVLTLVRTANGKAECEHLSGYIKDVCFKDYLQWSSTEKHLYKLFRVPVAFPKRSPNLPIDPYFLGVLLGDGGLKGQVCVTKPDVEILALCQAEAAKEGGSIRIDATEGRCPMYFFRDTPKLVATLRRLGLKDTGSAEKFIPFQFKTGLRQHRIELLAGLMDSDGSCTGSGYDFISKSEQLSRDVAFVARSLGFSAYVSECEKSCQNDFTGTYYRVSINGDLGCLPCRLERKKAAARAQKKSVLRTGFTYEAIGEDYFYGFTLDDDGRYLLDDFTVTHNSGKTVMAGELIKRHLPVGPCLFLADAQELVAQAADKVSRYLEDFVSVEMADEHAWPGDKVVCATTQSIARRLDKWPRDYFKLIIVDEAHRNTLGQQAQGVLGHFSAAQVIGITATPFRSDKKQLSSFYETISCEIDLVRLIKAGYLSRITVKQIPLKIDVRECKTVGGDYSADDLGNAVTPHLQEAAKLLREHASDRRSVVFLPLVETSKAFVEACQAEGLKAVHVDGKDRTSLDAFRRGEANVIANASLLTTGWDEPSVDCCMILRPTKSQTLYSQMVGRGTRIHDGKTDLLLLDPLYLSEKVDLIRPARLLSKTEEEERTIQARLDMGEGDILTAEERAAADRHAALIERAKEVAKRKEKTMDVLSFALSLGADDLADYEPTMRWEAAAPTDKQREILAGKGFDLEGVTCKGMASKILDLIFKRQGLGLASPKQVKWLVKFGHPDPYTASFEEASEFLDRKFSKRKSA